MCVQQQRALQAAVPRDQGIAPCAQPDTAGSHSAPRQHTCDRDAQVVASWLPIDHLGAELQHVAALLVREVVARALADQLVLDLQRLVGQVGAVAAAPGQES